MATKVNSLARTKGIAYSLYGLHLRMTGDTVGTGIGNIKAVADKYKGFYQVDLLTDTFVIKMILPDIERLVKHI